MINSLEITNLQSHKYSLLEFHKGVNIIKGRSHSGKSSIIRALRWALQNRPTGFHFKSHFSKPKENTDVFIEFENHDYLGRERGHLFNGYSIGINEKETHLEALRTDVPDEVKALTQMNEINIQSQGDKYFMLQETPGTVAKELNNIVGLDIIDEVNKKVTKIYSGAMSTCGSLSIDIKNKKEEIKKYKHLRKAEKIIKQIDSLVEKQNKRKMIVGDIEFILLKIQMKEEELNETNEWLQVEKPFKEIRRKQRELVKLKEEDMALMQLTTQLKNAENKIHWEDKLISLEKPMKQAKSVLNKLSEMRLKHGKISKLYEDMINTEKSLKLTSDTLKIKIKEKSQLLKSHKNEFCVKCGAHQRYWRKNET